MKRVFTIYCAALAITGCGLTGLGVRDGVTPNPEPAPTPQVSPVTHLTSQVAFEQTTYVLVRKDCASCHGAGTGPQFAASDPVASHTQAVKFVSFSAPSSSKLVTRSMDGHCGSNCTTNGSAMRTSIEQWKTTSGQ